MPAENIKRAVMRGTGELPGVSYEDVNYEAYGPGGVAIIMRGLTDNKNRTVAELNTPFPRVAGTLAKRDASAGCSIEKDTS